MKFTNSIKQINKLRLRNKNSQIKTHKIIRQTNLQQGVGVSGNRNTAHSGTDKQQSGPAHECGKVMDSAGSEDDAFFIYIHMSVHRNIIPNYNQQNATFLDLFISTDAVQVSGGSSAHHQEHKTVRTVSGIVNQYCCAAAALVDNTWSCVYSFVLLMMGGGTAWNM